MTTGTPPGQASPAHTWEGDAWDGGGSTVYHCTSCGLVTTSTDTRYTCRPRPPRLPQQGT